MDICRVEANNQVVVIAIRVAAPDEDVLDSERDALAVGVAEGEHLRRAAGVGGRIRREQAGEAEREVDVPTSRAGQTHKRHLRADVLAAWEHGSEASRLRSA